jgi:ABC-type nitrate/sulfonate/bicarbonate transport system substrate-binding protein
MGLFNTARFGRLVCLGTAIAAVVALAGCYGSGEHAATLAPPEQPAITVDAVPAAEEGGLYVAQAQGFFRQQGLTVTIRPVTGSYTGIGDLQSGKAQLAAGSYVLFILAEQAGRFDGKRVSLRIIAAGSQLQPCSEGLYVMPGSRYTSVAQLAQAHASIGLSAANDVGDVLLASLLEQSGYSLRDIREVVPAGGVTGMIAMLAAGKIAAALAPQPVGTIAEETVGAIPLADFDEGPLQDFPYADGDRRAAATASTRLDVPVRPDAGRQGAVPDHRHDPAGAWCHRLAGDLRRLTSSHHRVWAACPIFGNLATAVLALVYPSLAQV